MSKIQLDTPMVNEIRSSHWRRRCRCRPSPRSCSREALSSFPCGLAIHRGAALRQQRRMPPPEKPRVHAVADELAKSSEIFELHHAVTREQLLQARVGKIECLSQGRHPFRGGAWHVQLGDPVGDAMLKARGVEPCTFHGRQALLADPFDERFPSEFKRIARELARDVPRVRHAPDFIFCHLSKPKDQ